MHRLLMARFVIVVIVLVTVSRKTADRARGIAIANQA
jgi:hypothetical protein